MLQPVTKVVLIRKPKLHVERKSIVEQLEVNPKPNVKKKCQKPKFQLFPLAVTSITNHENIKGDNSSLLQHPNWLFPAVHLNNHPTVLNTHYRGSPDKARSNLVLQRNFNKSSKKFLILKTKESNTKDGSESKKNNILKEKLLDEEQINSAPKRKKLECFSNSPHSENKENLDNRNTLLLPYLPKNDSQNQQQLSSTEDCLLKSFVKKINSKTETRLLQVELEEELKKVHCWEQIGNNQSVSNNSLPHIKNLPKNSVWNWFNGTTHYPRRRNLLLDWYTYDFCHPLSLQSWPSVKEKNDIEIVGTQVGLQGSQRNSTDRPYIFTPVSNEMQGKMLKNFNGINVAQCFNESRVEASSSDQICPGQNLNEKLSQNLLPDNSFLCERDSHIALPKRICKLPKRVKQTKQLSPFPIDTLWAKINLKEEEKHISAWNHFTQQKPIQLPMSVLKQLKTKNSTRTLQNNENMKIQPEFIENLAEKNLLYQS